MEMMIFIDILLKTRQHMALETNLTVSLERFPIALSDTETSCLSEMGM